MQATSSPPVVINNSSNFTSDVLNSNLTSIVELNDEEPPSKVLIYVLVPLGTIVLVVLLVGLVIWLVQRARLDKLRHHLMPVYSFDPAEEGEDWEAELLEEGMTHQPSMAGRGTLLTEQPKLAFSGGL